MKKLVLPLLLLITTPVWALAQNAPPPLITVSGQAEVRVPPDEVVFTLGVEFLDKDISVAQKRTDDAVRQVLAIAKANNVKNEDVQTSHITIQPKYNTDDVDYEARRALKREFIGYQAFKQIGITLRDISRFDSLLTDVLKGGVTRLSNVEFRDSKVRLHKDQARAMAMKAAQEKAQMMAREIGQGIGPAYTITEEGINTYNTFNESVNASRTTAPASAIAPGTISVSAQVTVSFRLIQ